MNVLFLTVPVPNYLPDVVYAGMVALLGAEHVHEWPMKPSYHGGTLEDKFGQLVFQHAMPPEDVEAKLAGGYYDLVLADSFAPSAETIRIAKRHKTVILDGADDIAIAVQLLSVTEHYAKREYVPFHHQGYPMIFPLPFGYIPEPPEIGYAGRSEFVTFLCADTGRDRAYLAGEIERRWPEATVRCAAPPEVPIARERYRRALQASQIGISLPGAGYDTYRYWEIPAHGACLLAVEMPILIPGDFVGGEECLRCKNVAGILETLHRLEPQGSAAQEIAAAGEHALYSRHTARHRAEAVLNRVFG